MLFVYPADRSPHLSKKIVIADDKPHLIAAVEFLLRRSGYEAHV
jgi:hypothetical protein